MTLYIKRHHMSPCNSGICIKSPKICICLRFVTLHQISAVCLSAHILHLLFIGRFGGICPRPTIYILRSAYNLSKKDHFRPFSKVGLGKMGRGEIPNPHLDRHPPQSFLIYYAVEYQQFSMFTLSKSKPKQPFGLFVAYRLKVEKNIFPLNTLLKLN